MPAASVPARSSRQPLTESLVARPARTAALRRAGVDSHELAGPLWTPVIRGVHGWLGTDPTDALTRILAVAAVMPAGSRIGGWAALRLLGVPDIDGRTGPGAQRLLPVTVCTGPVARMRPRPDIDVDRSTILATDLTEAAGIPVTTTARSCVDVARRAGAEEGLVAADAAVAAGLTSPAELAGAVGRLVGVRGVPRARLATRLADGRSLSRPESRFRYVWVVEAGLPPPLVNASVLDPSGRVAGKPDLLDLEAAVVGEYDGSEHRELGQHTADNDREERFEHLNLLVVRATSLDLWPRRPLLVQRLRRSHARGLSRDRTRDRWDWHR